MKYSVKIIEGNESSYLKAYDRIAWSYRTAKKHAKEFITNFGGDIVAVIENEFGDTVFTINPIKTRAGY
jgi:hypothetical protein